MLDEQMLEFIDARAAERGLTNLDVVTCDVNVLDFPADRRYDRVVSVEMFEHMRNYEALLGRVASWMAPGATLFVHIFTHTRFAYTFEIRDESGKSGWVVPVDNVEAFGAAMDHLIANEALRAEFSHNGRMRAAAPGIPKAIGCSTLALKVER